MSELYQSLSAFSMLTKQEKRREGSGLAELHVGTKESEKDRCGGVVNSAIRLTLTVFRDSHSV